MEDITAVELVSKRKETLMDHGFPETIALGQACEDLRPDADTQADIAAEHDIEVDTLKTYRSKAHSREDSHIKKFLTGIGGYRKILALHKSRYRDEWTAIVTGNDTNPPGIQAYTDTDIQIVSIRVGGPSGEPSANIHLTTQRYPSLDELREDKYDNTRHHMEKWYALLIEAGYDEDKLKTPSEKLPDSHPDSEGFETYQYTSLMPDEQ